MKNDTIYSGLAQGGPHHGKPLSAYSRRVEGEDGQPGGFYVHMPANGVTPSGWRWIERKVSEK